MTNKNLFVILLGLTLISSPMYSQVTIGADKSPEKFSVLELISNNTHGLRLPLMTTTERDEMTMTDEFQAKAKAEAEGLTIFNTDTQCVEVWNGTQWISWCAEGTIGTLVCESVTGVNVTQGTAANEKTYLPYSEKSGASIALTDGQVLGGPVSGLYVQVDGAQIIYAPSGSINIKIVGTATTYGTVDIPVALAGASCNISVTAAQQAGAITSLGCASVTGISVTEGTAANETALLPYYGLTGASIFLTDGQILGSVSGLSVQVNGAQTLSAPDGDIAIKITGTAVTNGTIDIPVSVAGATCNISVTSNQQGGTIGTLQCSSITGVKVIQGINANVTALLPYFDKQGADIYVTNGTVIGTAKGLSAVINGDTTITDPQGDIPIKIIGKADIAGTIDIPVGLAGASCNITVTSAVIPPVGYGTFTGRICFDVVEINDGGDCGKLDGRKPQKADFTLPTVYTQTYTFTASGNISNVRFYVDDPTGQVIQSYTPDGYPGATSNGATRTLTVYYYTDLNQKAKGLSRTNALTATIYTVYTDGTGVDKMLKLKVSVQDCSCCPGYLRTQGEYVQKTSGGLTFAAGSNFATVSNSFTATKKDVCFFMNDYPGRAAYATANSYCNSASSNLAPYASMGWRLPNLAELGYIQTWALSLSTQPTSITGTTNMLTTPYGAGTGSAYYVSSTLSTTGVSYGWSYGLSQSQLVSVDSNTRCVFTMK